MSESIHESIKPIQSEAIPPHDSVEPLSEIVQRIMGEQITPLLSSNQQAMAAWYGANGDRERSHTTRVFLKKSKNDHADPILCVYVDSHAFFTDMHAKREIYLSRLANWGFFVSGIEFAVDRNASSRRRALIQRSEKEQISRQEDASPELREHVDAMVKDVPESIRESISKAIIASYISNSAKQLQS